MNILPEKIKCCDERIKIEAAEIVFIEKSLLEISLFLKAAIISPSTKINIDRAKADSTHFEGKIKYHLHEIETLTKLKEDYQKELDQKKK